MNLNIQALQRTTLFKSYTDYLLFLFFISIITSFSLLNSYEKFLDCKRFDWHTVDAKVISETEVFKAGKTLTRYKLKSDDFTFYINSFKEFVALAGRKVSITIRTETLAF